MRLYTEADFKLMPWKNGGGTTLELFSLRDDQEEILFRLSSASVKQDGPFSIFPHIERILFLVSGNGFKLKFADFDLLMANPFSPITFAGEEVISCELLDKECVDFNVMTNRNFGSSKLEIKKIKSGDQFSNVGDMLFIYLAEDKELYHLELNQEYNHKSSEQLAYIIEVRMNNFHI